MTERKHLKTSVVCGGCGREFGIIQHSHIVKCEGLVELGITNRAEYKAMFGDTMSKDAKQTSINNIKNFNDSLTAGERSENGRRGIEVAHKKHGRSYMGKKGGTNGAKALWAKPGQLEKHRERMRKQNANGYMMQNPNKLEEKFWNMIGRDRLEFASFKFWKTIHKKGEITHITPDFRVPGTLKLVEVFGDYWHDGEDPMDRISLWESVGCECVVIWEHEIHEKPEYVVATINKFISGNHHECLAPASDLAG